MTARRSIWRTLVSPEMLFLLGALQANLPYLLWQLGYPIMRGYRSRFDITYMPLYLWILAYLAFCLGAQHLSTSLFRKRCDSRGWMPFRIHQGAYRCCVLLFTAAVVFQVFLACRLYGVVPILAYFSGYNVGTMNQAQEGSGLGQLGLLMLTRFMLTGLVLIGLVGSLRTKGWNRVLLWMTIGVVLLSSVFTGKTQGLFAFVCLLFTGSALAGANPINLVRNRLGFREYSSARTIAVLVCLICALILIQGFIHYVRTPVKEKFRVSYAFDSVASYLSWPLMNMERQADAGGLSGGRSDWSGLLTSLLPYKLRKQFFAERDLIPPPTVERTSPSGFLSPLHWYLGVGWMLVFMFAVGALCKYLYCQSRHSLFCLLAYSQIAWTLVAAHSYNHFLNLMFIPMPIAGFFVMSSVVGMRRRTICTYATERETSYVAGLGCHAQ